MTSDDKNVPACGLAVAQGSASETPRTDARCADSQKLQTWAMRWAWMCDHARRLERESNALRGIVADAASWLDAAADDNPDHWASDESRRNAVKEWAQQLRIAIAALPPNTKGQP